MKRATEKFIMRQNGEPTNVFARLARVDKKKLLIVGIVITVALLFAGLYLWYVRDLRAHNRLNLEAAPKPSYEWMEDYGEDKINEEYLWGATKELLLKERENNTLIVSWYTIPGTLYEQEGKESGQYFLEDQALLLDVYLEKNDALSATALVNAVNDYFDLNSGDVRSRLTYLDAYLKYYSMYGKSKDLDIIKSMVDDIFDENGLLNTSTIFIDGYTNKAYVGAVDRDAALEEGGAASSLELLYSVPSDKDSTVVSIDGVLLGDIRLLLIRNLENNGLLPAGSYDRNLELVLGGLLEDNSGLLANGYYMENGKPVYFQTGYAAGQLNVFETVTAMRNLSEVGELPAASLAWVTESLNSPDGINHGMYKIIEKSFVENANDRVLYLVLQIAINVGNEDMFFKVMDKLDLYRATYHNSPALHMIYTPMSGGRNGCYAWENLMIASTL